MKSLLLTLTSLVLTLSAHAQGTVEIRQRCLDGGFEHPDRRSRASGNHFPCAIVLRSLPA